MSSKRGSKLFLKNESLCKAWLVLEISDHLFCHDFVSKSRIFCLFLCLTVLDFITKWLAFSAFLAKVKILILLYILLSLLLAIFLNQVLHIFIQCHSETHVHSCHSSTHTRGIINHYQSSFDPVLSP